jgi:hypothetical protein
VRPLQDRPATTTDGRGLTYVDALTGVLTGLRTGSQWPTVIQGLTELAVGRGDVLLGRRDAIGRGQPAVGHRPPGDRAARRVRGLPVTPHQGGISLTRYLGASLLTVDGDQHRSALIGKSECVDRTVADYLIDLRTPPAGARCAR